MILYVNACVRENSRTNKMAKELLAKLGDYEEIYLETAGLEPLGRESLERAMKLEEAGDYSDKVFDHAKKFASADIIVIAAPFWDYGFPALLKIYLENIYAIGIVSEYDEEGIPIGLCKAKKLYYVTTAGGKYVPDFSYTYIEALAKQAFGIPETELLFQEYLDI